MSEEKHRTLVSKLKTTPRLEGVIRNSVTRFTKIPYEKLTLEDCLGISASDFYAFPNAGRKSYQEWSLLLEPLRGNYDAEGEAYRTLKEVRTTLLQIAGAHRTIAALYGKLAERVLSKDRA